MDTGTLDYWRKTIIALLKPVAEIEYPEVFDRENRLVVDPERDAYTVITMGWEEKVRRIHGCLVHIEIIDDKIWIQTDGTEHGIATELIDAGISKEHIVLGFKSKERRALSGFAAA